MASLDGYLDRACAGLRVDPAEAEDIRRELRAHLEERLRDALARGASRDKAITEILARFGEPEEVLAALRAVHQEESWWAYRLKGMVAGAAVGAVLSLLLRVAGHGAALEAALGTASGACIGLLSVSRTRLVAGLAIGALTWFAATVGALAASGVGSPQSSFPLQAMHSVLLSLITGGVFGMVVAAGATVLVSLLSRPRSGPL